MSKTVLQALTEVTVKDALITGAVATIGFKLYRVYNALLDTAHSHKSDHDTLDGSGTSSESDFSDTSIEFGFRAQFGDE
jgi:hypothetical protein